MTLVMVPGDGPREGRETPDDYEYRAFLSVVPPGRSFTSVPIGWAGMGRRPGVEISFTDRAGVHWLRSADGSLVEIPGPALDYYGVPEPVPWSPPTGRP